MRPSSVRFSSPAWIFQVFNVSRQFPSTSTASIMPRNRVPCIPPKVVEHGLGHLLPRNRLLPLQVWRTSVLFLLKGCVRSPSLEGDLPCVSGKSMENALRACCQRIKIGKILIHGQSSNGRQLIYKKLPEDIASRHILLLDPTLSSGNSAVSHIVTSQ